MKAVSVATAFSLAGLLGFFWGMPTPERMPHAIFFATLVVNTFFSVRFYADIQPNILSQAIVDVLLASIYVVLGISIGSSSAFALAALGLFALAPIKYVLMLSHIPHRNLLRKKIRIDVIGLLACTSLLLVTIGGYGLVGAWVFAIGFMCANIYLLLIRPMYSLA